MNNTLRWKTTAAEDGDCAIFTDGEQQTLVGVGCTVTQTVNIVREHNKAFAPTPELEGSEPLILYFANESDREGFIKTFEQCLVGIVRKL